MARISIQSAKQKGRLAQQKIRDAILTRFPTLTDNDVVSCPMGSGGMDIQLSEAARLLVPLSIESKARATGFSQLYDALEQADRKNGLQPVAVVKQDRRKPLVVVDLEYFLDLLADRSEK